MSPAQRPSPVLLPLRHALGALATVVLCACGGGGGSNIAEGGGVGSGGTGISYGTVTGFGSVIVDGVHYGDASAEVQTEDNTPAEARLGQSVAVTHNAQREATRIEVRAQLRGPVDTLGTSSLRVAGYAVDVIAATDTTRQATVVQDEQGNAVDVLALQGDVEVHGVWLPSGATYRLAASRIEQLASPASRVLVSGVVTQESGKHFALNGGDTQFQGSSATARGQYVATEIARAQWNTGQSAPYALELPLRSRAEESGRSSAVPKMQIELRGTVLGLNASRSVLKVRGVRLLTLPAALDSCVQEGVFVEVKAQTSSRAPGLWIDDIRCVGDNTSALEGAIQARQGEVANLSAAQRSFQLKNTSLTVTWDNKTYFKNTTRTTLLNGAAVEVEGVIVGSTLRARKIKGE